MRNKGIVIELTALLDVILTMMFLIVLQSGTMADKAGERADELLAQYQATAVELEQLKLETDMLLDENGRLKRIESGRSIVEDNSSIIYLSIHPTKEVRELFIETEGETRETVRLDWDNRNYASNALNAALTNIIDGDAKQAAFIVFEYDRNLIYQSDYALVMNVIQAFKQNPDVYVAEYDINLREDTPHEQQQQ